MASFAVKILIIFVIIILFIYIVHTFNVRQTPGKGGKLVLDGSYTVTLGDACFRVNGIDRQSLKLKRGGTYEFKNTTDEPLYFTTHAVGGQGGPGSLSKHTPEGSPGLYNGSIYFKITDDLPDKFYYQSDRNNAMGGEIIIG